MGGAKRPAFQFYPADWMADTNLMLCSLEAQGLWIFMLCVMHHATPYGYLRTTTGRSLSLVQLAKLVRTDADRVKDLLAELEEAVVFSRDADGTIYSRRMVSDGEKFNAYIAGKRKAGRASAAARWGTEFDDVGNTTVTGDSALLPDDGNKVLPEEGNSSLNEKVTLQTPDSISSSNSTSVETRKSAVPFDDFWKLYPKKDGRKKAETAWRRLTVAKQRAAMAALPAHVEDWKGRQRRYIPLPATWIYQERWDDELNKILTGGDDVWIVDTYRREDHARFQDHKAWQSYLDDYAVHQPPRSAKPFEQWLEEGE